MIAKSFQLTPKPRALVLLAITCILLVSCDIGTGIHYIIPDDYEGFLVIQYNCPNSSEAIHTNGSITIQFNQDGFACIADAYEEVYATPTFTIKQITTPSGQLVPFKGSFSLNSTGYALTDLEVIIRRSGQNPITSRDERVFSVLWVGELSNLVQLTATREYSNELERFFDKNVPNAW